MYFMNMDTLKGLLTGVLFGMALYIAGATNRNNILNMLKLKDFSLMKIILFAIGIATICVHLSLYFGVIPESHFSIKPMYLGVIFGAAILAIGFGMIGLCPGTAICSYASGYKKALTVIIGGFLGAYIFSKVYGTLQSWGLFKEILGGKITIFHITDKVNYIFDIGPLGGVVVGIIFIIVSFMLPEKDI